MAALVAGFLFTINAYLIFWVGSAFAVVLLLVLIFFRPEDDEEKLQQFENLAENQKEDKSPSMAEILNVFKMIDLWKIIIFIMMSWAFYTVFDQQMFPDFFTKFFSTPAIGQQAIWGSQFNGSLFRIHYDGIGSYHDAQNRCL